jgi:SAM-dependent methyltransferase
MEKKQYHTLRDVEDAHWWFRSLNELAVGWIRGVEARGRPRVLDAGCGTGGLLARLAEFADVEGLDASDAAVELARARGVGSVRCDDLNAPTLEPEAYDAIACVDVLYHRGIADDAQALRNLVAALRPGGLLFLHLPAYAWLRSRHDDLVHGVRRYRLAELESLLVASGLEPVHASYRYAPLLPPIALWRLLSRPFHSPAGASEETDSDVGAVPAIVNLPLLGLCRLENRISRRWTLPFGSSVYGVGRKPAGLPTLP